MEKAASASRSEQDMVGTRAPEESYSSEFKAIMSEIDPDNSQNPRMQMGEIVQLKQGMAYVGESFDAVLLQKHDDPKSAYKWRVRAGHRRIAAARALGWSEIAAREFAGSQLGGMLLAITEQEGRAQLSSYDRARHFARIKAQGHVSSLDVFRLLKARGLPYGQSTVQNLIHSFEALTPKVRDAWATGDKRLTEEAIMWLVSVRPASKQIGMWDAMKTGRDWKSLRSEVLEVQTHKRPRAYMRIVGSGREFVVYMADRVKELHSLSEKTRLVLVAYSDFLLGRRDSWSLPDTSELIVSRQPNGDLIWQGSPIATVERGFSPGPRSKAQISPAGKSKAQISARRASKAQKIRTAVLRKASAKKVRR